VFFEAARGTLHSVGIRVIVIEDDARLRARITDVLLKAEPPILVCGDYGSAKEANAGLDDPSLDFDVALVDLRLPDGSGVDLLRKIRATRPKADPVVITVLDDANTVLGAIRAGARGYVLKDWSDTQIVSSVRDVVAGGAPMSPRIARLVLSSVHVAPLAGQEAEASPSLTDRERDVLDLLCEGRTYRETGTALGITVGTVQTHVKAIYGKLEVESKAELTAAAFRLGLLK